jgi:tetratricopeptide (TPR) repeat protein
VVRSLTFLFLSSRALASSPRPPVPPSLIFGYAANPLKLRMAIASLCLALVFAIAPLFLSTHGETTEIPSVLPISARDFWRSGNRAVQLGDYERAIADYSQAIELDSQFAAAYSNRCWVYLNLSADAQAQQDCTSALQQSPNNAEAYLNRGLAAYRQGDDQAAIADYNAAIRLHPTDPRPYYNRGLIAFKRGNYLSAVAEFTLALRQTFPADRSTLAKIYTDRGLSYAQLGNEESAIADFSRSLRLDPSNASAYYNRALTYQQQQRYEDAIADFTRSLQHQPDLALAHVNRGLARDRLGQRQAAIEDLDRGADSLEKQGQRRVAERVKTLIFQWRQNLSTPVTV